MEWKFVVYELKHNRSILAVARELGIEYSKRGACRMCNCFMHEDKKPSLWLQVRTRRWGCPVCKKIGNNITLVMEHEHLEYHDAVRWLAKRFDIEIDEDRDLKYQPPRSGKKNPPARKPINETNVPKMNPVFLNPVSLNSVYLSQCYSTESPFCQALVSNNILTYNQMRRAALRYHLGVTRDGGVIFWQIDREERLHDGKIMFYRPDCHRDHDRHPTWVVSRLIQQRQLPEDYAASRCLFGSHLIEDDKSIAIVESEKTAVICSELFPDYVWLATGGLASLSVYSLMPLKGLKIIIFPDTDPDGKTYAQWLETANDASRKMHTPITVHNLLELNATPEQKARKIDIADYIISNNKNL